MNLLINFGPLKIGGGQNVALNFIHALKIKGNTNFNIFFVVCESSLLLEVLLDSEWRNNLVVVSSNPVLRILQEMTIVNKFITNKNISLVYTYFGYGFFRNDVKQVIGSADSNLYFPEIDFWHSESFFGRIKRFLVDKYRVYGLQKSTGVVFENKAMFERSSYLFNIKSKCLILPSIALPEINRELNLVFKPDTLKILLLCGWQRNKNILLIPELAFKLHQLNLKFEFIITVKQDDSSCSKEFFQLVDKYDVKDFINCIGPVSKANLPSLYNNIDQVILLSLLESFSNNIIEAWFFKRPLIISDELWSRSICGDAAFYVPRNDTDVIATTIINLYKCKFTVSHLIDNGLEELTKYPDINERVDLELNYLESFYD